MLTTNPGVSTIIVLIFLKIWKILKWNVGEKNNNLAKGLEEILKEKQLLLKAEQHALNLDSIFLTNSAKLAHCIIFSRKSKHE